MKKKVIKQIIDNIEQCLLEDTDLVKKMQQNNQMLTTNLEEISKIKKKKNNDKS